MPLNYEQIQKNLCEHLCADVKILSLIKGRRAIETPFTFPDGDPFQIYLEELPSGKLRLTDNGHTLMQLSYEMDIESLFKEGARGRLKNEILDEMNAKETEGAFYIETSVEKLSSAIFQFGQTLDKIYDLLFLHRTRVSSAFYDDLRESLLRIVEEEKIEVDYAPIPDEKKTYYVDYKMKGKRDKPIFLYGIPNRDKARLTTIMLAHFRHRELAFESLLVFENQEEIPRRDLARLSDVGGEMVSSLSSEQDFLRKIKDKVA